MPRYTTSYNRPRRPTYRKSGPGSRLPGSEARRRRKPGAQYLRQSPDRGWGRGLRLSGSGRGFNGNSRMPYALIAIGCACLLFLASVLWYANRGVDVTLNGKTVSVRINSSVQQLIDDQKLELTPGKLLAVDDSVLNKTGGEKAHVTLDGTTVAASKLASTTLTGGEKLKIRDGRDRYEAHTVKATTISPKLTVSGSGPIQFMKTWGTPGRSEVWTGKVSGKTKDRGTVRKAVDAVVSCRSVMPTDRTKKVVALTFNSAPSANTEKILKILKEKKASATFFLQGSTVSQYASAAKSIAKAGYEVGSNGMDKTSLATLSKDNLRSVLGQSFEAVKKASGVSTGLLRPAGGTFSAQNWADATGLVQMLVLWNVDSGDWTLPGAQTVTENVMGSVSSGDIILMTDSDAVSAQTVEALPGLLDQLEQEGYTVTSVAGLIKTDSSLAKQVTPAKLKKPEDAVIPEVEAKTADGSGAASTTG